MRSCSNFQHFPSLRHLDCHVELGQSLSSRTYLTPPVPSVASIPSTACQLVVINGICLSRMLAFKLSHLTFTPIQCQMK